MASKMGLQPRSKHFSGCGRTSLRGGCMHSRHFQNISFHLSCYLMHVLPQSLPPSTNQCIVTCYCSPAKKQEQEQVFMGLLKVRPLKSKLDLKQLQSRLGTTTKYVLHYNKILQVLKFHLFIETCSFKIEEIKTSCRN